MKMIAPSLHKKSKEYISNHLQKVEKLQQEVSSASSFLALTHSSGHNTTRSKNYKKECLQIDMSTFNEVLVDPEKKVAFAEPKVTMDQLVRATLPFGLMPKVVPEFKGITVGGAIMGAAGESSSFKYGIFNDTCLSYELLCGDGTLLTLSLDENADLYYGIAGSYGTLGILVQAEIELTPAPCSIHIKPFFSSYPEETIEALWKSDADFIDGLAYTKEDFFTLRGYFSEKKAEELSGNWYFQEAKKELLLSTYDYLFRYDQGAFWMGAYLLRFPLFYRFFLEGVLKMKKSALNYFSEKEIASFGKMKPPLKMCQKILRPWLSSESLWKFHHKAGNWVTERMMVQDFCLPKSKASLFLQEALDDPGIFPLWLCPIRGTPTQQLFSPHQGEGAFVNIGIYGVPAYSAPLKEITKKMERKTKEYGGRKVLYSHSYYSEEEFWEIYPKAEYQLLRKKVKAEGILKEITDKVIA